MKWLQKTSITEYSLLDRTYFKRLKTSGGMLLYGTYICIRNVYLWMSSHCLCLENMWKFFSSRKRIRRAQPYLKTGFGIGILKFLWYACKVKIYNSATCSHLDIINFFAFDTSDVNFTWYHARFHLYAKFIY